MAPPANESSVEPIHADGMTVLPVARTSAAKLSTRWVGFEAAYARPHHLEVTDVDGTRHHIRIVDVQMVVRLVTAATLLLLWILLGRKGT